MCVKSCDLINLGECHFHLGSKRGEVRGGDEPVMILDKVEVFDQQIAAARPIGQKRADLFEGLCIELSAFWRAGRTTAAATAGGGLMFK